MGFYDTESKRKLVGIRLTPFQQERLGAICRTFGISSQRLFTDLLDSFYVSYWQTLRGTQSVRESVKDSAQKCLDDMVQLKDIKGEVQSQYPEKDNSKIIPRYHRVK